MAKKEKPKPDYRHGNYFTSFCNQYHRLRDGMPVEHNCFVLPTAALHAEAQGMVDKARDILGKWKLRRESKGVPAE